MCELSAPWVWSPQLLDLSPVEPRPLGSGRHTDVIAKFPLLSSIAEGLISRTSPNHTKHVYRNAFLFYEKKHLPL